jgi:DNA-binding transcriptional MerR regulator
MNNYPGTTVQRKAKISGKQFLSGIFMGSSGIVMQQLTELTGLKTPTVQNWVSRGFIPHPVNKRYTKDSTARIFIINALRETMNLEDIKKLLIFVNGSTEDHDDDIIPESALYGYFCEIITDERFSFKRVNELIDGVLQTYEEKIKNAKHRLKTALEVICVNYLASDLLNRSANIMGQIKEKNIFTEQL